MMITKKKIATRKEVERQKRAEKQGQQLAKIQAKS
jgi:hypothetical protein